MVDARKALQWLSPLLRNTVVQPLGFRTYAVNVGRTGRNSVHSAAYDCSLKRRSRRIGYIFFPMDSEGVALKHEACVDGGPKVEVLGVKQEQLGKSSTELKHGHEAPGGGAVGKMVDNGAAGGSRTDSGDLEKAANALLLVARTADELALAENLSLAGTQLREGFRLICCVNGEGSTELELNRCEFQGSEFFQQLKTSTLGGVLVLSPRLQSTQTLLSQNFKAFPVGTVCVADVQYKGRGRGGNTWESPKGCLMFSMTLQESNGRTLPFLQYVVCLAVVKAVEEVARERPMVKPMDVRIKWPNDLYAGGVKIGGILCTSTYTASEKLFNVVVGCGFNVSNEQPTTCLNALLAANQSPGSHARPVSREELLSEIVNQLEVLHDQFVTNGFDDLREAYLQRWLHTGQRVELEEANGERIWLTVEGLTSDGYLLAVDGQGEKFELHPDGNSLDFFKGLVRKKLTAAE